MISLSVSEILNITGGRLIGSGKEKVVTSVTTDSRKIEKGALFVAIKGERADGHDYILGAFEKGAVCALSEMEIEADGGSVIVVSDTVRAMGKIARLVLDRLLIPKVAITGSVGKTTTRDMTHAVMSQMFKTLKNDNNFNNEIGVPLTIFKADEETEASVIEMGMDNFGEIDRLSSIVKPDVAIITNIGMSHIERLGSRENIYKAKAEIFKNTRKNGVVILNGDDKILMEHKDEISQKVITIGILNDKADLLAKDIEEKEDSVSFKFSGMGREAEILIPIPGKHNVLNALLAIAVGIHFGVSNDSIKKAFLSLSVTGMRMDIINTERVTIINDCYNAAPDSVSAALSVLSKRDARKVAVLGDIAALGTFSYNAHKGLGREVVKNGIDLLITIGENARYIAEGAFENGMDSENFVSVDTLDEVYPVLSSKIKENDVILVKASRVMGLEKVTEFLKNNF